MRSSPLLSLLLLTACQTPAASSGGVVRPDTPPEVDIVRARARGLASTFSWKEWGPEAFAEARKERRFLLIDGAAEWCHWCHVMDETTYRDPEVGRLLSEHFVAIRVDVDAHPDLAERWSDYGWPATLLLTPDAQEVGHYRGYMPPERLRELLQRVEALAQENTSGPVALPLDIPATPSALPWVVSAAVHSLDSVYDEREGSWGTRQKVPMGDELAVEALRAGHGDTAARQRLDFTLEHQRAVLDPVWGGFYQYSAANDWKAPHFEKLMTLQAANLEAYAAASALTQDATVLADARRLTHYIETFLGSPEGTFYTNQDADVGAHDQGGVFVDGHEYYARDDAGRRALGMPWVDTHVYARENGLAVAALVAFHQASGDPEPLERARKAMDVLLKSHVDADGSVWREASRHTGARYLVDAAELGRALALLAHQTGEARYREAAVRMGQKLLRDFADPSGAALFEATEDPYAAGVFAQRGHSFSHNVSAARFLAALHTLTGEAMWRERGRAVLAGAVSPASLDAQGRFLGAFLLTADALGVFPWPHAAASASLSGGR